MVVQTVPLRRGWYQVAVDFREGNPELCAGSNVVLCLKLIRGIAPVVSLYLYTCQLCSFVNFNPVVAMCCAQDDIERNERATALVDTQRVDQADGIRISSLWSFLTTNDTGIALPVLTKERAQAQW
jgi:hypothetical protein